MSKLAGVLSAVLGCVMVAAGCRSADAPPPPAIAIDFVLPDPQMLFIRISPAKYGFNHPDFLMLDTEVTNKMYARYLIATGATKGDDEIPTIEVRNRSLYWSGNIPPPNSGNLPVVLVNDEQATAFCDWLTLHYGDLGRFRLPSKTEWLIAAYGSGRLYPWGNQADDSRYHHASAPSTTQSSTQPLRQPEQVRARLEGRTPEGLFGMWGNVSELVIPSIRRERLQYTGAGTYWMGGGFNDTQFSPAQNDWGHSDGERRAEDMGFRVLLDPTQRTPATQPATKPSDR